MRKLLFVLLFAVALTLTGCHAADPPQMDTVSKTDSTSAKDVQDTHSDLSEAESSSASAIHDESENPSVAVESKPAETTPPPKNSDPATSENISSDIPPERTEEKSPVETEPTKPEPETPTPDTPESVPAEPNATAADSSKIADLVVKYINDYRTAQGVPTAARLPGLTGYAEYRSHQLISNFAHDTDDERAAATALQYGECIDPSLYGMTGESYYTACAGEAIAKAGYTGTADNVAQSLAKLIRNSPEHWCYVGASEYLYIGVGVTYESGMWYCDIALSRENYG